MKRTFLDKAVGWFSPQAGVRREQARIQLDLLRGYEAAKNYKTSDWVSANKSDANAEDKYARGTLRDRSRDLSRNNPWGLHATDVIVADTVGAGIMANISGRNQTQTKRLNELWKEWAETTLCDYEDRHDFYGLQGLMLRTIVESGEGLGLYRMDSSGPSVQLLEPDYLVTEKDDGDFIQGVEIKNGKRESYTIYKDHPGSKRGSIQQIKLPATQMVHVFNQKRAGQVRGMPWAHAAIEPLKNLDDYQTATLIGRKVAACFGGVITTNDNPALTAQQIQEKRQSDFEMKPASFRRLAPGEDIKLISPPGVDGYSEFNREHLRAAAAAYGMSYEALTGDYSQSNYSSSRMGQKQYQKNIDTWRWKMLIPQFCQPSFRKFLEWASRRTDISDVSVQWVPPASTFIDPTKEVAALKDEVRAGFKSWDEAVREQGRDPHETLEKIAEWNTKFDEKKVVLDIDPRKITIAGIAQAESDPTNEVNNSEQDKKDATGKPNPGSAE